MNIQHFFDHNNDSGSIALIFAAVLPVAALLVGGTIDFVRYNSMRANLQSASDAAALAAAKEITLVDATRENLQATAQFVVDRFMKAHSAVSGPEKPRIATTYRDNSREVDVSVDMTFQSAFADIVGFNLKPVSVNSVARIVGTPNVCVLALEGREPAAISLNVTSRMTGNDCGVFSNSRSETGISVVQFAEIEAETICSAGGVVGHDGIKPKALLDCPQFDDPLANRPEPEIGACDYTAKVVALGNITLQPGVYCAGLTIIGLANVTLTPGTYIIRDGLFTVEGTARLQGNNVSIYLGQNANLMWGPTSSIELSASQNGPMAGLLLYGARTQSGLLPHSILSRDAQKLTGTIYLPKASLIIDGNANVGNAAAYTAIVARRIVLLASPHVVLNARYDDTDVPVPDGIRSAGQSITLVE